jgi:hypothetical protein
MKKLIIIILCLFTAVACGGKKLSGEFLYASNLYSTSTDYYLKGEQLLADISFYKSVDAFQRMDDLCNISRLYIGRYVLSEDNASAEDLVTANRYASLDSCEEEKTVIAFLSGNEYDADLLEEPYSLLAKTYEDNKTGRLVSYAGGEKTPKETASRLYRFSAAKMASSEPEEACELLKTARELDSLQGWTLNIYRDLNLMLSVCKDNSIDKEQISKRSELLRQILIKK